MSFNNPIPHSTSLAIHVACGVLFALFSFTYLFCLQGDLLAEAQYVFSGGVTTYYRGTGAVIITAVLMAMQWGLNKLTRLEGRFFAVSYFPSLLVLAVMTSLSRESIADFSFGGWCWAFPLLVAVYCLAVWAIHKFHEISIVENDYHLTRYLWPNFLTLFVMMLLCGACNKADDVYLYELKAERLLLNEEYEDAGNVGLKALVTSPRLNNLRCYALLRQGQLTDRLFDYPQPYGSQGLLDLTDTCSRINRFTVKDVCAYLGALPNSKVTTPRQYLEIMLKTDSLPDRRAIIDYYLCSLLLDKDIPSFRRALARFYHCSTGDDVVQLPRIYKEALILDRRFSPSSSIAFPDTLVAADYAQYCTIKEECTDSTERSNQLHRKYGNTLWWHLE